MLTREICSNYHAGVTKFANTPGVKVLAQVKVVPPAAATSAGATLFAASAETFLENHNLMDGSLAPQP